MAISRMKNCACEQIYAAEQIPGVTDATIKKLQKLSTRSDARQLFHLSEALLVSNVLCKCYAQRLDLMFLIFLCNLL